MICLRGSRIGDALGVGGQKNCSGQFPIIVFNLEKACLSAKWVLGADLIAAAWVSSEVVPTQRFGAVPAYFGSQLGGLRLPGLTTAYSQSHITVRSGPQTDLGAWIGFGDFAKPLAWVAYCQLGEIWATIILIYLFKRSANKYAKNIGDTYEPPLGFI